MHKAFHVTGTPAGQLVGPFNVVATTDRGSAVVAGPFQSIDTAEIMAARMAQIEAEIVGGFRAR